MRRLMKVGTPITSGVCFCCLRQDDGIGVFASGGRIAWSCKKHAHLGRIAFAMPLQEFNRIEKMAAEDAGAEAGAYLSHINQTDLAELTKEQWEEFCQILVQGFGDAMERHLKNGEAPF